MIDYTSTGTGHKSMLLHSYKLNIIVHLTHCVEPEIKIKECIHDEANETINLIFEDELPQTGSIRIKFIGKFNDTMKGFYKTKYRFKDKDRWGAATHFEPTYARRAFPCFDEPELRATFDVSAIYQMSGSNRVVSNMPTKEYGLYEPTDCFLPFPSKRNIAKIKFHRTPKMSTYLLAICYGDFGYDDAEPVGDYSICPRIFATKGKEKSGKFALFIAQKAVLFYERFFGIEYMLPKLDLMAVPDFPIGAMENWGLITYRETRLLVDPVNSTPETKQSVALVIAHEIAHQWFGNLVTIKWWTHLWLKEGFASFMEYLCVDKILPEGRIWQRFLTDDYAVAMKLDALHNSHPIEVPIEHASEIPTIFDAISYCKGASVIRMIYKFIGDEAFRKGLKLYLEKFSYSAAETNDLWDALESASEKPVREIMNGWTLRTGYPWISITQDGDKLTLKQSRFTADGKPPKEDLKWMIPVAAVTDSEEEISFGMMQDEVMVVDNPGGKWVKFNPGCSGLYRCAYPPEMFDKLLEAMTSKELDVADRFGLLNDYFALCQAGKVDSVSLLKMVATLKEEKEYIVWTMIDSIFARLSTLLSHTTFQSKLYAMGRELYKHVFAKLGWVRKEGEPENDVMLRPLIIERLISFEDTDLITKARLIFKDRKTRRIRSELLTAVTMAIVSHGDDNEHDQAYYLFWNSHTSDERNRIAKGIGTCKDSKRLNEVIRFALSSNIRLQDKNNILCPIGSTHPHRAFEVFQEHEELFRSMESGPMFSNLLQGLFEGFASEEMAEKLRLYFEENEYPGSERTVQQVLETIRLNADWLARDRESLETYLSTY